MDKAKSGVNWSFLVLVTAISLVSIGILSVDIVRHLKLLGSANSDNIQWNLSQAEVEFLEYQSAVDAAQHNSPADLKTLRREYDVFFSRITTLCTATLYEGLRATGDFKVALTDIKFFLDSTVAQIDGSDAELIRDLPLLRAQAAEIRPKVRGLALSGLAYFAIQADNSRSDVSQTLISLAAVLAALMAGLALLACYLSALNRRSQADRAELLRANSRMKAVTTAALDGVIVTDGLGDIQEFNQAAESIFQCPSADVLGRNIAELIVGDEAGTHPGPRPAGQSRGRAKGLLGGFEHLRRSAAAHFAGKGRVRLYATRANGDVFPVELAIQSAQTGSGDVYIAFLRDISFRVRAEAELVKARDTALQSEQAKTEFLAVMSHEIRTPLNGLLGNLALMRDTGTSPKQDGFLDNMEISGRLLMDQVSNILDITKYEAGKLNIASEPVNISEMMQALVDSQAGQAEAAGTLLEWGWRGVPMPWVLSDRNRLQHVMLNLIGNAIKFTRQGRITVELEVVTGAEGSAPATVEFRVTDTGIGIGAEAMTRVFDDFVAGDNSYSRRSDGTGLGLGIAKRFITAMEGTIVAQSTPGVGSVFTVTLPFEPTQKPQADGAVVPVPAPEPVPGRTCDILVVEDNEINRQVVHEMLLVEGHNVTLAHDGTSGVQVAAARRFDLILMDISMPGMDGRAATRAIRHGDGASRDVPIVALTANVMAEELRSFRLDGMNSVLSKPLMRGDLLRLVAELGTGPGAAAEPAAKPAAPESAPQEPEANLLDFEQNQAMQNSVGSQAYQALLSRFQREAEETLDWLQAFQADLPLTADTHSRVHNLASSAAVFGARRLREQLVLLETAARCKERGDLVAGLAPLAGIWRQTKHALWQDEPGSAHEESGADHPKDTPDLGDVGDGAVVTGERVSG